MIIKYDNFLNEELKVLKGPSNRESDEALNNLSPDEALWKSVLHKYIKGVNDALERGANVNVRDEVKWGWTVLMTAASIGNLEIVKLLVEHGADVNLKNVKGNTALILAAQNDNFNIVKYLVEKGADVKIKNEYGKTALYSIENRFSSHNNINSDIINFLKQHEDDENS
jgi:ankyrin repeat protein